MLFTRVWINRILFGSLIDGNGFNVTSDLSVEFIDLLRFVISFFVGSHHVGHLLNARSLFDHGHSAEWAGTGRSI